MLYRFYESGYTAIHMHRQGTTTHPTDSGATGRNDTESRKFEAQEGGGRREEGKGRVSRGAMGYRRKRTERRERGGDDESRAEQSTMDGKRVGGVSAKVSTTRDKLKR